MKQTGCGVGKCTYVRLRLLLKDRKCFRNSENDFCQKEDPSAAVPLMSVTGITSRSSFGLLYIDISYLGCNI